MAISLFLAMRNEAFIKIFSGFIAHKIGAEVIGACHPAQDVEGFYNNLKPDILLIDIKKDSTSCFDIIKLIVSKETKARIIGITASFHEDIKVTLEQIGAKGYLLRNDDMIIMEKMLSEVYQGRTMFASAPLKV